MNNVFRVVSVSGGKDSTALYLWAIDQFGSDGFRAVFADTGHEHPVTYNYVRNLHLMAAGPKVIWLKADLRERIRRKHTGLTPTKSDSMKSNLERHRDYLEVNGWTSGNPWKDMLYFKGCAPSSKRQFCTEILKLEPIKNYIENFRGDNEVHSYVGIRAGESTKRAKMPESDFNEYFDAYVFRPLLRWSEDQVFDFLRSKKVPPNPLYDSGMERVGCFPCIHARKAELARLPDWAWERLREYERITGWTWFPPLKPGVETTIDDMREWARTSRGGTQFEMFPPDVADVPSCMSTWGACE